MNTKFSAPIRKLVFFIILQVVVFSVLGIFAECAIRILRPWDSVLGCYETSERYGKILKKNYHQIFQFPGGFKMDVSTNSHGHRAREYDLDSDYDGRIFLLGDSFVFGYGVDIEDRFDNKLARKLKKTGENYLLINSGVPGWGTIQETLYARDHFEEFKPNIVVLTFCNNDPNDDRKFERWAATGRASTDDGLLPPFAGNQWLRQNSRLYLFLYKKLDTLKERVREQWRAASNKNSYLDPQTKVALSEDDIVGSCRKILDFHRQLLLFNPEAILIIQVTSPDDVLVRKHLSALENGSTLFFADMAKEVSVLSPEQRVLPHDGHWSVLMHEISSQRLYEEILSLDSLQDETRKR